MQFTPAQLATAFAPSIAKTGKSLDVVAMKAAQEHPVPAVQKVELAAPGDPGDRAIREEKVFDHLVRLAKQHGGTIGTSTVADIEMGRHHAREDRAHEAEHGFRSLVRMNEATYEAAKAKGVPAARFSSPQEALNFASDKLADIRSNLLAINSYGGGDATVGGAYEWLDDETKLDDPFHAWMDARNQDRLEGSRMDLYVNAEYLKATFGIDGSILETREGKLQIRAFDIEHGGEIIARSIGDGSIAPYRTDGSLEMDRIL